MLPASGNLPAADTLCHYLQAAYAFLIQIVATPFDIYTTLGKKTKTLVPLLGDLINQRRKWQQPQQKRQPYTRAMMETFREHVRQYTRHRNDRHLDKDPAIFNWKVLGIFTGCRSCEYAQTAARRGTFATIPDSMAADSNRNLPIAFTATDFLYLDNQRNIISHDVALRKPHKVVRLRLQFRFDKSGRNFTVKEYGRGEGWLCPIQASLSIIRRATILGVKTHEPVGVYRTGPDGSYTFLQSNDIIKVMRHMVVLTYPDANHFLRKNIKCIVAHSNRVTAAVALRRAGWDIPAIAHRLRWRPESVDHYLRECHTDIDALTAAAIHGSSAI